MHLSPACAPPAVKRDHRAVSFCLRWAQVTWALLCNPKFDCLILILILMTSKAFPAFVHGRFTAGAYTATERFSDSSATGSDKNDFQIVSSRMFLQIEKIGNTDWESSIDLRDKHDFFDKLDRERLQLTARNDFQARQLSVRNSTAKKFLGLQFGRFPIQEAGAVYVDGAQAEEHWTPQLVSSVFAGLNPKPEGTSYLVFDPKASVAGATLTFQRATGGWDKNLYLAHSIVQKSYSGNLDRFYLFHNGMYQWEENSRLMSLIYFDTVPNVYVQTANVSWQQEWGKRLLSDLSALSIDVIEYSRRQSVLSRLPSSPYSEGSLLLTWRLHQIQDRYYLRFQNGKRSVDNLTKNSAEVGFAQSGLFGPKWDLYTSFETGKNFTSNDIEARLGVGFFSRVWEWNLDTSYGQQANDDGTTTHPKVIDTALSYYISRKTFSSISGQIANDEKVQILSAFFRIGYRFGDREVPPVRDGAPPRGAL